MSPTHMLPAQLNTIIGRTQEIAATSTLLRCCDVRLLTLLGPGGVGKTRLGLAIAKEVATHFRDGVFFVSLAALREPQLVLPTIAQVIGVEEVVDSPLTERLWDYLSNKQLLLVLDNFEHVLAAGFQIAELLAAAPDVKVLVTSREILHLYGEHEFEVLPLALPQLPQQTQNIPSSAAMTLFVQRAQTTKPSFILSLENARAVAEICIQLDGLPLAIELAAARIKLTTAQDILTRLQSRLNFLTGGPRNLPLRQQTLRNTLDWSYHLLNEEEQHFFRRLGVLVGSWTLAAAEAIGTRTGDVTSALTLLTSLVDKSFVRVIADSNGETRFTLLETLREYALDCLAKSEDEEVATRRQHAQFYLRLVEEGEQYLFRREQRYWLERLDQEVVNMWAAMRWILAHKEVVLGLRFAGALIGYLNFRSSLGEGRNWFEEVLAIDEAVQLKAMRVKVLYGAGVIASMHSELPLAYLRLHECSKLASEIDSEREQALALGMLATLELQQGHYATARNYVDAGYQIVKDTENAWLRGILHSIYGKVESKQSRFIEAQVRFRVSLMVLREVGDLRNEADVFTHLGSIMRQQGKLKTAHFFYTKSLALLQMVGDSWSQAACLNGMGDILRLQGEYAEAQAQFEACLALAVQLGNKQEKATALAGLGQIALYRSDIQQASRYLKESLHLTKEIAYTPGMVLLFLALGDLERSRGNSLIAAEAYYKQCLMLTRTMNDRVNMTSALFGLGEVARLQQDTIQACTLLKQSLQLSWEINDRLGLATSLETFAWFCQQIGLPERAAQFLGTTEALRDSLQIPLAPTLRIEHERVVTALQDALGEIAFNESWSYGRSMTLKLALSMVARIPIPTEPTSSPEKHIYPAELTAREIDVLRLVAAGLPDARIAEQLVISPRTVNTHLRSIYAKISVSSRSAATRFAFEHHIV